MTDHHRLGDTDAMHPGGRRGAALLLLGTLCLAGCGEEDSSSPDEATYRVDGLNDSMVDGLENHPGLPSPSTTSTLKYREDPASPSPTPTPDETPTYEPPTYEPPDLDSTQLEANLAQLSPADRELVDHHLGSQLGEGTWLVASPMTVEEAKAILLGPDPEVARKRNSVSSEWSAYAFLQVGDGVLAHEDTGFSDPPKRLLAALSRGGGTAAVATDNIEAMVRFGYARDGEIVFDDYEYAFVDDLQEIPAEVRDLARLAWEDFNGPMVETANWFSVATAMSEKVTGVRPTRDVRDVTDWYVVPLPWGVMEDG